YDTHSSLLSLHYPASTKIYTLSLHDALPISSSDHILVAEAWVSPPERLARYVRPDEMHQAFNFDFLETGWDAEGLSAVIADSYRSEAHTSELQSRENHVCRLLHENKSS